MIKLSKTDAFKHETDFQIGWYYQLPELEGGRSVIYAEVTGDHGQRVIKDKARVYYIISGTGEFIINGEQTSVKDGDLLTIPPFATYEYHATSPVLKVILYMDLIDLSKLPQSKK